MFVGSGGQNNNNPSQASYYNQFYGNVNFNQNNQRPVPVPVDVAAPDFKLQEQYNTGKNSQAQSATLKQTNMYTSLAMAGKSPSLRSPDKVSNSRDSASNSAS